jgi:acyl-CoA thioester hydrolase
MTAEVFIQDIIVRQEDIDQLGHVNNVVYLRYVQEMAIAHWTASASPEDQAKYFWVVTRHEIDYKRPAFENDVIVGKTWVGAAKDGLFERFTDLVRKEDGKVIARARTVWCPIDPKTMRPTSVSESVYERFSTNRI